MIELNQHYENARRKASVFMELGQISSYMEALFEMNRYKKLMVAVSAN